jgi:hypothetical protein
LLFMTFSLLAFKTYGQAYVLYDFESGPVPIEGWTIGNSYDTINPDPERGKHYLHTYQESWNSGQWCSLFKPLTDINLNSMEDPFLVFDYNTGDRKSYIYIWTVDPSKYGMRPLEVVHSSKWEKIAIPLKQFLSGPDVSPAVDWEQVYALAIEINPMLMPPGTIAEFNIDNVFLKAATQNLFDFEDGIRPEEKAEFTIENTDPDTTGGSKYLKVAKTGISQWTWIGAAEKRIPTTNLSVYEKPLVTFLYKTGAKKSYLQIEVGDNANMKWGYSIGQLESSTWTSAKVSLFDVAFSNWGTDPLDWSKVTYIKIGFTTGDLAAGSDYEISIDNIKLKESLQNYEPLIRDFALEGPVNMDLQLSNRLFASRFTDLERDTLVNIKFMTLPDAGFGTFTVDGIPVTAGKEIQAAELGKLNFIPAVDWWGKFLVKWKASDGEFYPEEADLNITVARYVNLALNKPVVASSYTTYNYKEYANDGLSRSAWRSKELGKYIKTWTYADTAWIYFDLGVPYEISCADVYWSQEAFAKKYIFEISDDAVAWTPVDTIENTDGSIIRIIFNPVSARYVRIYTLTGKMEYCDLVDLEVYNKIPQTILPVGNTVFGKVDNTLDFSGLVDMRWDNDSVYMVFKVQDDSIVTSGNAWQVDNIEIYFDMDNSKRIHWPRNGAWMANDTTFDDNDFQLRLVPDVPWETINSLTGAYQVYKKLEVGYDFELNIPWSSLMTDFVPQEGKEIGFDVLVSDNDAMASDANRNQITWNCPTIYPFNDPSIWGVLQLDDYGTFVVVPDEEKPTAPANLTAEVAGSTVTLTWDPSTDNRVVQYYVIYDGSKAIDTVLAKQSGNSYTVKNLEDGKHTLLVYAFDPYGNNKGSTFKVDITGKMDQSIEPLTLYPNPAGDVIYLGEIMKEKAVVEVYDLSGQLMMSCRIDAGESEIYIGALPQGMYTLRLRDSNKVYITKWIKQ